MEALRAPQNSLLQKSILWKKHPSKQGYWFAEDENEAIFLRMNNFPSEFLFTVIAKELIEEFDELPTGWIAEE